MRTVLIRTGTIRARAVLRALAEGNRTWALPWPCIHEFLAIVTHPRIFDPPSTLDEAIAQTEAWTASPSATLIGESPSHWKSLTEVARSGEIRGPRIHDARIATICLDSGISESLTHDRDFSRFPSLRIRNPLIAPS